MPFYFDTNWQKAPVDVKCSHSDWLVFGNQSHTGNVVKAVIHRSATDNEILMLWRNYHCTKTNDRKVKR